VENPPRLSVEGRTVTAPDPEEDPVCWMCDHPGATFADYVDAVLRPVIDRCGWAVQAVGPGRTRPPFAYTVGRTAQGRAELVVTGKAAAASLDLLEAVLAQGEPVAGHRFDLLSGPALQVLAIDRPAAHLHVATALYGTRVRAVQVVWADGRGRWPWEARSSHQWLLGRRGLPDRRAG
jgi:hypothetical protein